MVIPPQQLLPSPSAEEGGKEAHSMREKVAKWGLWPPEMSSKQVQPAQPYRLQPEAKAGGQNGLMK